MENRYARPGESPVKVWVKEATQAVVTGSPTDGVIVITAHGVPPAVTVTVVSVMPITSKKLGGGRGGPIVNWLDWV